MEQVIENRRKQWLLLSVVALALFLDALDGTIVNVVLPNIAESFGSGTGTTSWVVTLYYLAMAGLILIFGKIADCGAVKRLFIAGLMTFAISSLACGLSPTLGVLLVFRAVQGVGAAMMATTAFMLCVKYLPRRMATFSLSVSVLGTSLGAAVGPALGGVLGEMVSWHMVFFINVPIGLIGAIVAMHAIPRDTGFNGGRFDVVGAAVLFFAMVTGLYAMESIPSGGLSPASAACIPVSLILLAVFIVIERRAADPVLKISLFGYLRLDAAILTLILMNVCFLGALYLLPFYLQVVAGLDTISSGIYLFIPSVGTLAFCLFVGKAADRIGNRPFVIVSCVTMFLSMVIFYLLGPDPGMLMVTGLLLFGVTWGLAGGPLGGRMLENVPVDDRPKASSLISFFIYFGSAMGSAMFAGLFGLGSGSSGISIDSLAPDVFMDGFRFAMVFAIALTVVMFLLSAGVDERRSADGRE